MRGAGSKPGKLPHRLLEGGCSPNSRAFFIDMRGPLLSTEREEFCKNQKQIKISSFAQYDSSRVDVCSYKLRAARRSGNLIWINL